MHAGNRGGLLGHFMIFPANKLRCEVEAKVDNHFAGPVCQDVADRQ